MQIIIKSINQSNVYQSGYSSFYPVSLVSYRPLCFSTPLSVSVCVSTSVNHLQYFYPSSSSIHRRLYSVSHSLLLVLQDYYPCQPGCLPTHSASLQPATLSSSTCSSPSCAPDINPSSLPSNHCFSLHLTPCACVLRLGPILLY